MVQRTNLEHTGELEMTAFMLNTQDSRKPDKTLLPQATARRNNLNLWNGAVKKMEAV